MSFDGLVTNSIVRELKNRISDGKINQIHQPERDEIVIAIRTYEQNYKLILSASASNPRVHLTESKKENPITAPLFCMILRKHLVGGKIISICQEGFDRVIKIGIESYTELGDLTVKTLVIEIMNRHSNIILVGSDGKIIDSVKHIDLTVSAVRQVLPGFPYELPPAQNKINPTDCAYEEVFSAISNASKDKSADKVLVEIFSGVSPLVSREILYRFSGEIQKMMSEIDEERFARFVYEFFADIKAEKFSPCIVYDTDKKPVAFSCVKLTQYGGNIEEKDGISQAIDGFYMERGLHEHIVQRSAHIVKIINNNIERCRKKLAIHSENLKKSQNRDKYKIYGDLLTANMYRLEYGMDKAEVENYYENPPVPITINLKPDLSPSANAQRYYKLYQKAKTTEIYANEQIKEAEEELYYLETVIESVNKAETASDVAEIKEELADGGYIPKVKNKKSKLMKKTAPMEFMSSDGFKILVGRNNHQNDTLTVKMAFSTDIWLHTKIIPGSHTIIRTEGKKDIPETTIMEAAKIAAYFSKAKNSTQVPVDFTAVKNVKKPSGAKPGLVIYDNYNTVYVTPDEELVNKLK
ncbi:MAG: fibronectin/fibrinogen-binding protein [Ruminococcaceae bacterium]|nr:fibronectin/fibrinogen-binding protein [Oscillospiraceae bacterium]